MNKERQKKESWPSLADADMMVKIQPLTRRSLSPPEPYSISVLLEVCAPQEQSPKRFQSLTSISKFDSASASWEIA